VDRYQSVGEEEAEHVPNVGCPDVYCAHRCRCCLGAGEACRSMAAERSVTSALTTHVLDVSTAERFASAQVRLSIVSNCTQFRPLRGRDLALST
jgi:hypothetical protein